MKIISEAVLDRFRAVKKCQWCGREINEGRAHPHHWRHRGMGGGSRLDIPENLIAVDWWCHQMMEARVIHPDAVLYVIALREKTTPDAIVDKINELLRTPKGIGQ